MIEILAFYKNDHEWLQMFWMILEYDDTRYHRRYKNSIQTASLIAILAMQTNSIYDWKPIRWFDLPTHRPVVHWFKTTVEVN